MADCETNGGTAPERSLTIHLVDDVIGEKRCYRRALLVFLLAAGFIGLCASMTEFLRDYKDSPYLVTAKMVIPNSYPPLTFCPGYSADVAKIKADGLTMDHYFNLLGYFWINHDVSVATTRPAGEIDRDRGAEVHREVDQYLSVHNLSITDAVERWSITADDILVDLPSIGVNDFGINATLETFFTAYGLCFGVNFSTGPINEFSASFSTMALGMKIIEADEGGVIGRSDYLFVGDRARTTFPVPSYPIPRQGFGAHIQIHVSHMRHQQYCVDETYDKHMDCIMRCVDSDCTAKGRCSIDVKQRYSNLTRDHCNLITGSFCMSGNDPVVSAACSVTCPRICSEWFHSLSIFPIPMNTKNVTFLSFSYNDAMSSYSLEERYIYTWHGFLAGVGGQLSLWCGMSVLSVPQVVLYAWDFGLMKALGRKCKHMAKQMRFT